MRIDIILVILKKFILFLEFLFNAVILF
uniref:Uncharacterized protein n=1 Tax=Arundo donax TaxID=35708 RepID=A0A0A9B5V3_ARUDO